MYIALKHAHLFALGLSFLVFFVRGLLMMRESNLLNHRALLIGPHIINLLLIASGIALAVSLQLSPSEQPWLLVKIVALFVYIGLGVMTFKHPKMMVRKVLWISALFVFAFIVSIAKSRNPLGFLAGF
jgi:uncharacterized membrane protein SirB2